jgi:opacity protein-like surface antigen
MRTVTLIAAVLSTTLLTGAAQARGFYTSVYGGWNWDDVVSAPFVKENTGYVIGGTLGTTIDKVPGLRIELDMSHRGNEVDIFGGFISADHDTFALLGNVVYDLPVSWGPVHPYVLAGVGYGHTEATFENVSLLTLENSGVAWQLGAGVNTRLDDNVIVGVGYRYFNAPELEVLGTELSDGSNHSVVAHVAFSF